MATTTVGEYVASDWLALTLVNGWTAKTGTGTILPPVSWCQTGTTVNLRGEITPPGLLAGNLVIATLPAAVSPPYEYVFNAAILGLVGAGGIRIKQDGTINLEGVTALTSLTLNGLRFTTKA